MKNLKKWMAMVSATVMILTAVGGCQKPKETTTSAPTTAATTEATPSASAEDTTPDTDPETTTIPEYEGYDLLWNDEFDGTAVDMDTWNFEQREPGWTNNELQEYTDSSENIFVRDGALVLKSLATPSEDGGTYYTSGKVTTQKIGRASCRERV